MCAAASGATNLCRYLLQHGARVDTNDIVGDAPLHYAVKSGNVDVVRLLLEHKASFKARGANGEPVSKKKKKKISEIEY